MDQSSRAVLVTGAASGTGRAIARRFLIEGYTAVISSRRERDAVDTASALAHECGAHALGVKIDPADGQRGVTDAFERIAEQGATPDAVVLNAANLGIGMDVLTVDLAAWREVIETNVVWNFAIARQAALTMTAKGSGSIVFVGSNTSRRAIPQRSAYVASKGGLCSLTKALAIDLGPSGIRVNCLMPGPIKTTRWDASSQEQQQANRARSPLRQVAGFDEIADAAWFLSSDAASNITGADLVVDGGLDAQLLSG